MTSAAKKNKNNAKTDILKAAENLIKTLGFNGFSYKDISSIVGIRTSSIHYYFPTKNDLAKAVIQQQRAKMIEYLSEIDEIDEDAKGKLRAYTELYYELSNDGSNMCPIAMLSAERDSLSDAVIEDINGYFEDQRNWLSNLMEQGKQDGDLRIIGRGTNAAAMFLSVVEGAMILSKAQGSSHDFKNIINQMLNQLI